MVPGVYQATSFKLYTPSTTLLPRAWNVMYLDAAATVSFIDKEGNASVGVALPAGYQPFLVVMVSACVGANVYILSSSYLA